MSLAFYNLLLLFLFAIPSVDSTLGHSFYKWITETYGEQIARRFNRGDLGKGGSFGGGCHVAGTKTKKEPIILVNGLLTTADSFGTNWEYLLKHGYTKEEIYATTWGDGSFENIAWVPLSCKFVKQIRQFIEAVHNFTNSKVDVLAYSMGSPLTRKAILGGECVETKEDLGPPITDLIDTYVSVAGANFGVSLCDDFGECDTCSKLNGLDCESQFLEDINTNNATHYEGDHIFAIYSNEDDIIGSERCGKNASFVPNADASYKYDDFNHEDVMFQTIPLQLSLVKQHNGLYVPSELKSLFTKL